MAVVLYVTLVTGAFGGGVGFRLGMSQILLDLLDCRGGVGDSIGADGVDLVTALVAGSGAGGFAGVRMFGWRADLVWLRRRILFLGCIRVLHFFFF